MNGSVHTGNKQHQRNCPKNCMLTPSVDWALGRMPHDVDSAVIPRCQPWWVSRLLGWRVWRHRLYIGADTSELFALRVHIYVNLIYLFIWLVLTMGSFLHGGCFLVLQVIFLCWQWLGSFFYAFLFLFECPLTSMGCVHVPDLWILTAPTKHCAKWFPILTKRQLEGFGRAWLISFLVVLFFHSIVFSVRFCPRHIVFYRRHCLCVRLQIERYSLPAQLQIVQNNPNCVYSLLEL